MTQDLRPVDAPMPPTHDRAARAVGRSIARAGVTTAFAVTAFLGATLLFVVQPMVARVVLPLFGGSATVWSTTSLFFQVVLLAGYVYVHLATNRLGRRTQVAVHLVVLTLPLLAMPVAVPAITDPGSSPTLSLLALLAVMVGLPFAVLSTTGPLLQRWYSWTSARRASDPYFLYAASNLGSFGGLLAYPLVVERVLTLEQQRLTWSAAVIVLLVLVAACGLMAWAPARRPLRTGAGPVLEEAAESDRPTRRQQLTWMALAFLPSTLFLSVTSHLSTDIAPVPLLWVVPLAVYLATFVVAFARTSRTVSPVLVRAAVTSAAFALVLYAVGPSLSVLVAAGVDLVVLALVAFTAHSRLAASRPPVEHLTHFYLLVALGGAAGGLLNGLVAPAVFDRVWEYPGALVASIVLGVGAMAARSTVFTRRYGVGAGSLLHVLALVGCGIGVLLVASPARGTWWMALLAAAVLAGGWLFSTTPVALVGALVVLVGFVSVYQGLGSLETTRTFYGSYRVAATPTDRHLSHGTTMHGMQLLAQPREPTTYYARSGPLGQAFSVMQPSRVGIVGLGTGTIGAYGRPGDSYTFYEIDPQIVSFAEDDRLFTYLRDSTARITTVTGDGRLKIAEAPPGGYEVIVLDAFSSDAVPVHLLTGEAFDTYASRLAADGAILVHITNRYLDLEPVVAAAADRLGAQASVGSNDNPEAPATASRWVLVTHNSEWTSAVRGLDGWRPARDARVEWTDDYSSLLSVMEGSS